jgi:hypothetical protein
VFPSGIGPGQPSGPHSPKAPRVAVRWPVRRMFQRHMVPPSPSRIEPSRRVDGFHERCRIPSRPRRHVSPHPSHHQGHTGGGVQIMHWPLTSVTTPGPHIRSAADGARASGSPPPQPCTPPAWEALHGSRRRRLLSHSPTWRDSLHGGWTDQPLHTCPLRGASRSDALHGASDDSGHDPALKNRNLNGSQPCHAIAAGELLRPSSATN